MGPERAEEKARVVTELGGPGLGRSAEVYVQAAAFYVACLRAGFIDEATEFAEWYLDTFDTNLED